jgi:hypothetical protein
MTRPPLPLPGPLGLIQYAGTDMHAYADTCTAALQERVRVLETAIALAYGYLWCINIDRGTEAPVYPAEVAASTARRILRDTIDVEKSCDGINAAIDALKDAP